MRVSLAFLMFAAALSPAFAQIDSAPKVNARLIAEHTTVAPGSTVTVALEEKIRAHWHTYWVNPGEAGAPTEITWSLPQGWHADAIQWPYPKQLPVGPLMDYGYENTVWLLTDLHVPRDAKPGETVILKAAASWLVCAEVCIPEDATVTVPITIGATTAPPIPSTERKFAATRAKLPQISPWPARYRLGNALDLFVEGSALATARPVRADFFPLAQETIEGTGAQKLGFASDGLVLRLVPGRKMAKAKTLDGVLVLASADGSIKALSVNATPGAVPEADFDGTRNSLGIGLALLFAFLGGLILNLMPCVLPILAMKALAIASTSGAHPREAAREGFAYGVGAIASFMALGAAVVALRAGGQAIGWGFQLQEPIVVAAFALLIFAVGLNLSGVYEISSGVTAGDALTQRGGAVGAFFTGVLAVVVAAPCTAPFMAAALGYAVTQNAATAMLVFAALGLGFASPFVAIGVSPRVLKILPRPGAWMLTFKQVLAFPMYAAAVWLVWVLAQEAGANGVLAVSAAMVAFALAAWAWHASRMAHTRWRAIGGAVALIAFAVSLGCLWLVRASTAQSAPVQVSGIPSTPYSAARLESLRAANTPVFIDATAAWCITCLVNEKVALSDAAVRDAFAKNHIAFLVADWTNRNPEITALLQAHGRSGVPLYLYYAPGADAKILPQVLTPNEVLNAIAR